VSFFRPFDQRSEFRGCEGDAGWLGLAVVVEDGDLNGNLRVVGHRVGCSWLDVDLSIHPPHESRIVKETTLETVR
jgi:hypothetical protein